MKQQLKKILFTFIYACNIIPAFAEGISMIFKNNEYEISYMLSQKITNNQLSELQLKPVKRINNKYTETTWPVQISGANNILHFVIRYFKNNDIIEAQIRIPIVRNVPSSKYSVQIKGILLDSNKNYGNEDLKYCIAFGWSKAELKTSITEKTLPTIPIQSKIQFHYLDNNHVYLKFPPIDKNLKYQYRLYSTNSNSSQAVIEDSIILNLTVSENYIVKLTRTPNPTDYAGNNDNNPLFSFKSIKSQIPQQYYNNIITSKGYCSDTIYLSNFLKQIKNTTSTYKVNIRNDKDSLLISKNILTPVYHSKIHLYPGQSANITLNNQIIYNIYRPNKNLYDFDQQYDSIQKWISFIIQKNKVEIQSKYKNSNYYPHRLYTYHSLSVDNNSKNIQINIDPQLTMSKNYKYEIYCTYKNETKPIKNQNLKIKLTNLEYITITVNSICADLIYNYQLNINAIKKKQKNIKSPTKRNKNWNPLKILKDITIFSDIIKPHQWSKAKYIQRKHTTIGTDIGLNINSYDPILNQIDNQSCLGPIAKINFIPIEIGNSSLKTSYAYSPLYPMTPISGPSIGTKSELYTSLSIGSFSNRQTYNGFRGLGSSIFISQDKLSLNDRSWYTDKLGITLYYQNYEYQYLRKYHISIFKATINPDKTKLYELYKTNQFLMGYQVGVESKYGYTWTGQYYHNLNQNYFEIQLLLSLNYSRYR